MCCKGLMILKGKRGDRGYTLLEYCAGAAVIAGVVWVALGNLGGAMSGFLDGLAGWTRDRTGSISSGTPN